MYIKQFRSQWVRVPDPMRPGRRALEERLISTGATAISHAGQEYRADPDGWFEVPHEVGIALLNFRHPGGERFYTPAEVDEQVRLGAADADEALDETPRRRPGRPRKTESEAQASASE